MAFFTSQYSKIVYTEHYWYIVGGLA